MRDVQADRMTQKADQQDLTRQTFNRGTSTVPTEDTSVSVSNLRFTNSTEIPRRASTEIPE